MTSNLKGQLSRKSWEELCFIILDFAKMKKENAEWVEMKLKGKGDFPATVAYYKKKIREAIFAERIDLRAARQAVLDFRRLKPELPLALDMMLCYVETGEEADRKYGDLYMAFYTSMENMYISALKLMKDNPPLITQFKPRIEAIISRAQEGWGHRDTLQDYCEILLENKGELYESDTGEGDDEKDDAAEGRKHGA